MRVFKDLFNKITEFNAEDPTRHTRVCDKAVRIGINVMESWGYTLAVPSHRSALGTGATPNQDRDMSKPNQDRDRSKPNQDRDISKQNIDGREMLQPHLLNSRIQLYNVCF